MAFSKSFPRRMEGVSYPVWEDIYLSEKEEEEMETKARKENYRIMMQCIKDSQSLFDKFQLTRYQPDIINVATSLFDKRASHPVFWKEALCKEKFDKKYPESK